jgi:hypothetical protein
MPFHLEWAPFEFGLLWGVSLAAIGLHLRRLGRQAEAEKASLPPSVAETVQQK